MNVEQLRALVIQKSGRVPQTFSKEAATAFVEPTFHRDVLEYLCYCLPAETYLASGVRVLPMEAIEREMGEASAPGSFIRPFGYVIIAVSVGGNGVCLQSGTGRVFWVDHDSFSNGMIMFKNRITGKWEYLHEYSPQNVERAMVLLSDTTENFLTTLLADQLTVSLGALD